MDVKGLELRAKNWRIDVKDNLIQEKGGTRWTTRNRSM